MSYVNWLGFGHEHGRLNRMATSSAGDELALVTTSEWSPLHPSRFETDPGGYVQGFFTFVFPTRVSANSEWTKDCQMISSANLAVPGFGPSDGQT